MSKDKQRYESWQANLDPDKPLLLAATVVVVRDGDDGLEVLMVLRNRKLKFGGGSWVFPGGRVDETDYADTAGDAESKDSISDIDATDIEFSQALVSEAQSTQAQSTQAQSNQAPGGETPPAYSDVIETTNLDVRLAFADVEASPEKFVAAQRAAVRETIEETGLVVSADDLVCFSHWIPPPIAPKRFATWFFVVAAPKDQEVVVDGGEITDHAWIKPANKIRMRNVGEEDDMLPPTYVTLVELATKETVAELLEFAKARKPPLYATKIASSGEDAVSLWAGDAGYETANADLPGPRHRLVMSDKSWEYQRPEV